KTMRGFLLIVVAGLGGAALGCGVGWLVGLLSPEFIALVASPSPVTEPGRLGAALGLVCGLLLGALAMSVGLLVDVLRAWAGRGRVDRGLPANQSFQQTGPVGGAMTSTAFRQP